MNQVRPSVRIFAAATLIGAVIGIAIERSFLRQMIEGSPALMLPVGAPWLYRYEPTHDILLAGTLLGAFIGGVLAVAREGLIAGKKLAILFVVLLATLLIIVAAK